MKSRMHGDDRFPPGKRDGAVDQAYAKIIDEVNKLTIDQVREPKAPLVTRSG